MAHRGLALHDHELLKSSTSNTALAVSVTRQTTTAAISIGLPLASLTLIRSLWKLRTRSEIALAPEDRERVHPPQAGLRDGAGVAAEQDQHPRLVRLHDDQPEREHDVGERQHDSDDRQRARAAGADHDQDHRDDQRGDRHDERGQPGERLRRPLLVGLARRTDPGGRRVIDVV